MIQPEVEQEALRISGMDSTVTRSSAFIFQLCTGFGGIPQHLTEEEALLDCIVEESMIGKPKMRV
jgi:hypothetical protein